LGKGPDQHRDAQHDYIFSQAHLKGESSNRIFEELQRWQQLISPV
jgi:hypothetical protein